MNLDENYVEDFECLNMDLDPYLDPYLDLDLDLNRLIIENGLSRINLNIEDGE